MATFDDVIVGAGSAGGSGGPLNVADVPETHPPMPKSRLAIASRDLGAAGAHCADVDHTLGEQDPVEMIDLVL